MKKSKTDVDIAIMRLNKNKLTCKPFDSFGISNTKKIDVMINVIKNDMSEQSIEATYPFNDGHNESLECEVMQQYALKAHQFLNSLDRIQTILLPVR